MNGYHNSMDWLDSRGKQQRTMMHKSFFFNLANTTDVMKLKDTCKHSQKQVYNI